ncbi:hypothetical protein PQX77_012200 [Marasmius sp. AFHP31]|nr:hypothetical protein PQX77_012200 [Marasmius sp. AFHP31]
MQRQDSEARIVRDTGGVVLDWRWDEQEDPPVVPAFDTAAPGQVTDSLNMNADFETPFTRVLNTNYVPSNMERRSLWGLLREPEEQIRQLNEEICRLQAKRQKLKRFVDLHRALLSPSRRVPVDIWRLIFIDCLPSDSYGFCTPMIRSAPLLLTTICRLWREIALTTPNLWTSIHLYLPAPSPGVSGRDYIAKLRGRREGLKAWLGRSGSLPITVSLEAEQMHDSYRPPGLVLPGGGFIASEEAWNTQRSDFTELLAQYSHRWRMVVLGSGTQHLDLAPFEMLLASSLLSLEALYSFGPLHRQPEQASPIMCRNREFSPSPVVKLLTRAPSLRRLELSHSNISASTISLPIPWYRLNELSITHPVFESSLPPGQLMRTLAARCHSLATLSIVFGSGNFEITAGTHDPVQWPSLQKLRVVFCKPVLWSAYHKAGVSEYGLFAQMTHAAAFLPGVMETFNSITLPSLKKLSVGFCHRKYDDNFGSLAAQLPFEDLLRRSQCPLTHFGMLNPQIVAAENIIRILRQLETLESLNLGYGSLRVSEKTEVEHRAPLGPNGRSYRDASLVWKRDWLDRILREILPPGSDVGPQAISPFAIPVCPRLEQLSLGGCVLDDRDMLLDLAAQTRRAKLRIIRVDIGPIPRGDVWRIFDSLQTQRQDSEMMVLRDLGGLIMKWRWIEQEDPKPALDTATDGLPNDDIQRDESLWW